MHFYFAILINEQLEENSSHLCEKLKMRVKSGITAGLILLAFRPRADAASFWQAGHLLVMSNANVRLEYDLNAGTTAFFWKNTPVILKTFRQARSLHQRILQLMQDQSSISVINSMRNQVFIKGS